MVSVSANVVVVVVVELVTAMVVAPMHVHATFVVSTAAQIPAEAISVMAFVATMAFVGVTAYIYVYVCRVGVRSLFAMQLVFCTSFWNQLPRQFPTQSFS